LVTYYRLAIYICQCKIYLTKNNEGKLISDSLQEYV